MNDRERLAIVAAVLIGMGAFFAFDGYTALGSTPSCTSGICTTTTVSGTVLTTQVTTSVTTFITTVSGTVTTTTTTYNPSSVLFTITSSPSIVIVGQPATLTATPQVPLTGATYSWFFGDGTSSVGGASVSHVFASPLSYPVVVLVQQTSAGGSPLNLGSGNVLLPVSCPTTGCALGTPSILVVTVTSSYTGSGLAGASLALVNSAGTTVATLTTNQAGQAVFQPPFVAPGNSYTVQASAQGYSGASSAVTMPSTGGTSTSFNLAYACGTGLCPQSITGAVFGGSAFMEMDVGIGLFVGGGLSMAYVGTRESEAGE